MNDISARFNTFLLEFASSQLNLNSIIQEFYEGPAFVLPSIQFSFHHLSINPLSNTCFSIAIMKLAPTLKSFSLHIDFLYTRAYMAVGVHRVQSSEIYPLMRLAEWCT